ncbi:MAG: BREX-2 system phosphatase PglZ [Planctomycetota bacterium]|jgi:hypothetical protein
MSHAAPTFSQIKAQVAAIRKKVPKTRTVAIRTRGRWTGEARRQDGDEIFAIHQCDSPLAMRIALRSDDDVTRVLLTDLDDADIGEDVLLRLKPRKVVPLNSWQIVKSLFQAHSVDPRLTQHSWIADLLMDLIPPAGFSPVASGFLDAESVWPILLENVIGLDAETPDLLAILKWSSDAEHVAEFREASSTFRDAAIDWLEVMAGPVARVVLDCVARHERPDALAIGLAAGVVFHPNAKGQLEKASGKLEASYLGGSSPESAVIAAWEAAATDVVRLGLSDPRQKQQLLTRADDILREVGADSHAFLSDTSPIGFDQRLEEFGGRLGLVLSARTIKSIEPLDEARDSILAHDRRHREQRRLERVDMAMRLIRWLTVDPDSSEPQSLAEAASGHLMEGGFVDWARLALRSGDPVQELSASYAKLFDRVTSVVEQRSEQFAGLLRDWTSAKASDPTLAPVEQILDRIVAPLAAETPILVIVLDGMSVAVFRELMSDLVGQDWVLLAEQGVGLRPGLATVPSVTAVSRTSLLCGRLMQGDATQERKGFAEHAALVSHSRSNSPPVLFHKASLQESEDASLAADVRKEIGSSHRRVVGVVVNAIDDHLAKGEQIDTRWTRDEIKVLPVLLHEARVARRTVILLSDHGHVLDCHSKGKSYDDSGERWRPVGSNPTEGEVLVKGKRVLASSGNELIAPWSGKLRYGMKKNGYHGGVTPQEMVVPIGILSAADEFPAGWEEAPVDLPMWWETPVEGDQAPDETVPKVKAPVKKKPDRLFDLDEEETSETAAAPQKSEPSATSAAWISALLASEIFAEQKQLGGRAVPQDEVFTKLLSAIDTRGGKMTSPALARAIELPLMRLRGMLAVASRVLNVDGYAVLNRDDASDTVELDRNLLLRQFDLVQ